MSTATFPTAPPTAQGPTEKWFRRIAIGFGAVACLAILCHLGAMLWAQNEFAQPESVVAAQSTMLARDGTWYYSLKDYPYTVNAYMPLFYLLDAGLIRLGLPVFLGARLVSFTALFVI